MELGGELSHQRGLQWLRWETAYTSLLLRGELGSFAELHLCTAAKKARVNMDVTTAYLSAKESSVAAIKRQSVVVIFGLLCLLLWGLTILLGIYATMCVIGINTQLRHSLCSPITTFRVGVNGKSFNVPFYLKLLVNFAAEMLLEIQFSASNINLNNTKMFLHPFIRLNKVRN